MLKPLPLFVTLVLASAAASTGGEGLLASLLEENLDDTESNALANSPTPGMVSPNELELKSALNSHVGAETRFRVASTIGNRAASVHFSAKVRAAGDTEWSSALVLQRTSKKRYADPKGKNCGWWLSVENFSMNWFSFELDEQTPIEVLVQRLTSPIKTAKAYPVSSGAVVTSVTDEGAIVRLTKHARFTVDFDGGYDETNTGPGYEGPPLHSLMVFANPMLDEPTPSDSVMRINPADWEAGANPLSSSPPPGTTVLFTSGEHKPHFDDGVHPPEWPVLNVYNNVNYFFSRDAIVYAGFKSYQQLTSPLSFGGYGIISGEEMSRQHPTTRMCDPNVSPKAVVIDSTSYINLTGYTAVDFPNHHHGIRARSTTQRSTTSHIKVLGWRGNGDGYAVWGNTDVRHLFIRTQDDQMYLGGGPDMHSRVSDVTVWSDANGAGFVLRCGRDANLTQSQFLMYGDNQGAGSCELRDSNALYHRNAAYTSIGGRVFTHRTRPGGKTSFPHSAANLLIENFVFHDPHATLNTFFLGAMTNELRRNPKFAGNASRPCVLSNITFTNVKIASASTMRVCESTNGCGSVPPIAEGGSMPYGLPNMMQGYSADNLITDIRFNNVTIAGINVKDMLSGAVPGYWNVTTEYVNNIYADGVKVIGGAPVNPTTDTRPQCVEWAEDLRMCYSKLDQVFMKQKCAAICSTNTGCTAKDTFRSSARNGNQPRHGWCQSKCGRDVASCNGQCGRRCNTDCDCNEPSGQ